MTNNPQVVDVGVNLSKASFKKNWRSVVRRAAEAGVSRMVLTGVDMATSKKSLNMCQTWLTEHGTKNLTATVGVHPHHAKEFNEKTIDEMRRLLQHPLAVAVGECGLDYNRNFSSKDDQRRAFREQVVLACHLQMPVFLHERDAHRDLLSILDEIESDGSVPPFPPLLLHCFTGTAEEAQEYIRRGFFLSFAGTICKHQRGAPLREILPSLPLDRLMVETDAPFMGFCKERRGSEPADAAGVARKLAETVGCSYEEACAATTNNAVNFFRLTEE